MLLAECGILQMSKILGQKLLNILASDWNIMKCIKNA